MQKIEANSTVTMKRPSGYVSEDVMETLKGCQGPGRLSGAAGRISKTFR